MLLKVRDRYSFLRDVETLVLSQVEGTASGLRLSAAQEHTVHEYCHLATMQMAVPRQRLRRPGEISDDISRQLRRRSLSYRINNEDRTLAAELVIFNAYGLVEDEVTFLERIALNLRDFNLGSRVIRRLYGRRKALAHADAHRALRRIRNHAAIRRAWEESASGRRAGTGDGSAR